jgi:hypothetical protein
VRGWFLTRGRKKSMQVMSCIAVHSHTLPVILAKIIKNSGVLESEKMRNNPHIPNTVNTLIQPCSLNLDIKPERASWVGIVFIIFSPLNIAFHIPTRGLVAKSRLLFSMYFKGFSDDHQAILDQKNLKNEEN